MTWLVARQKFIMYLPDVKCHHSHCEPEVTTQFPLDGTTDGWFPAYILSVMQKLLTYITTEHSRGLSVFLEDTKWHGDVSNLIIMLNGTFVFSQFLHTAASKVSTFVRDYL